MKCPSCSEDNPDYVIYCGKCGSQIRSPDPGKANMDAGSQPISRPESARPVEPSRGGEALLKEMPLTAIAVNVRRIFIIFAIGLVLSIGSTLVTLWISVRDYDPDTIKSILTAWVVIAVMIMIFGLIYAIVQKRLTRTSTLNVPFRR